MIMFILFCEKCNRIFLFKKTCRVIEYNNTTINACNKNHFCLYSLIHPEAV